MLAASSLELFVRMGLSLALVFVLMAVVLKASRARVGPVLAKDGLSVCSRRQLTRSASVMVLRAGERHLLVAVNDQSVTLLAEGDDLASVDEPTATDTTNASSPHTMGASQLLESVLVKVLSRNR